ncbi:hypothetical protein A6V29_10370 [Blastococcus sp. CCUG 61487]|nr:hypothetical protein A6V29_10370 [Blastococcus sp. CCUG 61487]
MLLVVGAVLLVCAGAAVTSASESGLVRTAVLAIAVGAAVLSIRAAHAELRSSAETFAVAAAGLALVSTDVAGSPGTGAPLPALVLAGFFVVLHRISPLPVAWPLAAWVAVQVAALRAVDVVPDAWHTELFLAVSLVGLGVALFGRPWVARLALATTAPWWAAGVLGGLTETWTAGLAERWAAAGLMTAAAGGLLLARLRAPLDVLLGPPRLVPLVAGLVTGAAAAGAWFAGGPVAVAVAGFAGVLVATLAAGGLSGWRRGLLLPAALSGGILLAALAVTRLLYGRHWSELALLLLLTAVPTAWVALGRRDDRPVAAPTVVGCLAGAALLGLPDGWGSPLEVAVLLTALYVGSLLVAAGLDEDSRRATTVAGAASAAAAVVLLAASGAHGQLAVHLAVQGAATLAWGWWTGRAGTAEASAAWQVGAAQLVVTAWLTAALADLDAIEAYTLPAALGLLLAAGRGLVREPSRQAWGPGLVVAAVPSTVLAVTAPDALRTVLVLALAAVAMVAGARAGVRAPLTIGAGTAVVVALGLALRAVPWPVGAALVVGTALLLLGMLRERHPVAGFAARLADLR